MLGKIRPGRVNTGMRKFEEGHDRTMEHGISQEETGSSPTQLCTSRLLQRLSMQNSHMVRIHVSPSLHATVKQMNRNQGKIKFGLLFAKELIPDYLTCEH